MVLLSILFVLATFLASFIAKDRLPPADRLPMQWGLNLRPTWDAPRALALLFTPLLSAAATAVTWAIAGEEQFATLIIAAAFFAAHLFHLWLIRRHLGGGRN